MATEKIITKDDISVLIRRGASHTESVEMHGTYTAVCYDKTGNIKWNDVFNNTVVTAGKNAILNVFMGNAAVNINRTRWYAGLIVSNGYSGIAAGDTHASHAGWIESGANGGRAPGYSQTTRRQLTFSAASSSSKATSNGVVFNINVAGTIKGAFIANNSVKASANASGCLYSAGLFSGGDREVLNGDQISITYTASA